MARQYFGLFEPLKSCNDVYSRSIKSKSIAYIEGDENNFNDLKRNAPSLFARDIKCFVVVCSGICSSFMLNLAVTSGFGVETYFWITITEPVVIKEMAYPSKLTMVTFTEATLQKSKESTHFILTIKQDIQGRKGIAISNNPILRELIIYPQGKRHSILNPHQIAAIKEKRTLRVAIIIKVLENQEKNLLNYDEMKCQKGLLCWCYPLRNGTFAKHREPSCCFGLVMDILQKLKEDLDIELYIYEVEDHSWGHKINGSWTGLIGEAASGKADVAAQWITVTSDRLRVVDFTKSIHHDNIVLVSKYQFVPLPFLNSEAFAALSANLWILITALTVITGMIIYLGERIIVLHSSFDSAVQVLIYAMGLLFQRDIGGLIPKNLGSRVVSISLAMTLMVIMTTFTAVLTSRNIETSKILPISGLGDPKFVNPTPTFKIGTYEDYTSIFENSNKVTWRQLGEFMKPYNFTTFTELQERMNRGTLQAGILDESILQKQWKKGIGCEMGIVHAILEENMAFALPKNSPWTEPISDILLQYKANDFFENLMRKYLASKCLEKMEDKPTPFGGLYLSGACIMLVLGIFLSVGLLLLEYVLKMCVKRCLRKRKSSYSLPHDTGA